MGLLREIQKSIISDDRADLKAVLLKLRVLADRLGSKSLEEWINHEAEGYPHNGEIPAYRVIPASFTGTFFGLFGSGIKNAPIPPALIAKYAGEHWANYKVYQSIVEINELLENSQGGEGTFGFDASNLILRLQGKIYPELSCNGIESSISRASLINIEHAVRKRILDFTLELEKSVPAAIRISLENASVSDKADSAMVTRIHQNIIYGNATIVSSGDQSSIAISIGKGDTSALIGGLVGVGFAKPDATELAGIMASEEPNSKDDPFGEKAKSWIADRLRRAADGTKELALSIATNVLTEVALKFYGFK